MLNVIRTVAVVVVLASGPAWGHDILANGEAVPAWIKKYCCGPNDVHHLRPEQVHAVTGGWIVDGYRGPGLAQVGGGYAYPIPYDQSLPSQDGDYWAFYKDNDATSSTPMYCFVAPKLGS